MAVVRIPAPMRDVTGGRPALRVEAATADQALAEACRLHPGLEPRLFQAPGRLHPHLAVMADGAQLDSLKSPVDAESELVIIPAVGGGGGPAPRPPGPPAA